MSLAELTAMSNKYGSDHDFVLAGGGNTSYKDEKNLFIKGSGVSLAEIDQSGFVRMERDRLAAIWGKRYPDDALAMEAEVLADIMDARGREEYLKRPSVEVLLHDIFPQKFVLHVHPALINGITCAKNGKETVGRLFGDDAAWVPVIRPGYNLAACCKAVFAEYSAQKKRNVDLMFLENHGVFFAADSLAELDALVERTMSAAGKAAGAKPDFGPVEFDRQRAADIAPAVRMLAKAGDTSVVGFHVNAEIKKLVASKEAFLPLTSPYTPDQIVYCMDEPLFVPAREDIETQYETLESGVKEYIQRKGAPPKVVAVEGLGFYACGKDKRESDIVADVFIDAVAIMIYAGPFGGVKPMEAQAVAFISDWEVERYRKKVSLGKQSENDIAGRIAIVTGGAQGFGEGISDKLAKLGGNVVIADINQEGASATADKLGRTYGKERLIAVQTDVGNEDSVKELVLRTALEYGGLDAFIHSAGINKPGSLEEMDVATFERINKVNYLAYFLGAKYSSRIMKIQHRFAPGHMTDIIQINSKSGLAGSNKNFAYAGSKFGGIGLTQSFALELVEYGIKVNSICQGNFFDGPLWSDPVKGMFIEYLQKGKVKGAKTVEDVKRYYESLVPMKRGCRIDDLTRAVVYLIEQKYETGQAVPVTGGQIMLK